MMAVIGMEGRIESGIAGLDAQQVAVGTGFKPAPIGFFRLFADTKGQAQLAVAQFLDVADQAFDIIDEGLVLPFAGLDSQGAVLILIGQRAMAKISSRGVSKRSTSSLLLRMPQYLQSLMQ